MRLGWLFMFDMGWGASLVRSWKFTLLGGAYISA